jgi:hypothetical protein
MKAALCSAVFTVLASLSGCAKDRSLAPPPDSEMMTVTVKVPAELEAETLDAMYRSPICKKVKRGANGERFELPGYHPKSVQLQREGQTDLYTARLPIDGGGACQWRLSNIVFGVGYSYPTRFGKNVTFGYGGNVVVSFDDNRPSIGGWSKKVDGDLVLKTDYYPCIDEFLRGPYRKTVSLKGPGDSYMSYDAYTARRVYFEPVLHSDFVVHTVGPKVKKDGNYTTITYPDGSFEADGRLGPDFDKLQAIRLAAERKN